MRYSQTTKTDRIHGVAKAWRNLPARLRTGGSEGRVDFDGAKHSTAPRHVGSTGCRLQDSASVPTRNTLKTVDSEYIQPPTIGGNLKVPPSIEGFVFDDHILYDSLYWQSFGWFNWLHSITSRSSVASQLVLAWMSPQSPRCLREL